MSQMGSEMSLAREVEEIINMWPRCPLIEGVSEMRSLKHLSEYIKHCNPSAGGIDLKDDGRLNTLYSGNKIRKLEFILGDVIHRGVDEIWTIGGLGSHHVLATALHCQRLGIGCRVFHVDQPIIDQVRETLTVLVAAQPSLHLMGSPQEGKRLAPFIRSQLQLWLSEGTSEGNGLPYFVPAGGSSCLGTLGYLLAALEVGQEIKSAQRPMIERVYVPAGSGSTLAGLALGFCIAEIPIEVVGVRVVSRSLVNDRVIRRLIRQSIELIESDGHRLGNIESRVQFRILTGHIGRGYGFETERGRQAQELAERDDLVLDSVYTAKAMGALIEEAKNRSGRSLFWNTLNAVDLSSLRARAESLGGLAALPSNYRDRLDIL